MTLIVNCIGLGHWGPNLVRALNSLPDCRLGVVCDVSPSRLELAERQNLFSAVEFTTDALHAATDARADAVFVATPAATHFELAKSALWAGKHVFVEKPLCLNSAAANQLVELATTRGKQLAVGHVFLFNSAVRAIKQLIESGRLGPIQYLSATRANHGPRRPDVNVLWDLSSHDLSIFQYWLGADPQEVTACGSNCHAPELADVVTACFGYTDGMKAHVHANWASPHKTREIVVAGSTMTAVWSDTAGMPPLRVYESRSRCDATPSAPVPLTELGLVEQKFSEPLVAECQHFLDAIQGRVSLLNGGDAASRIVAALEAADLSMQRQSTLIKIDNINLPRCSTTSDVAREEGGRRAA